MVDHLGQVMPPSPAAYGSDTNAPPKSKPMEKMEKNVAEYLQIRPKHI